MNEINFYDIKEKTLFIDQKREFIPANAGSVKCKYLDIVYAEGGPARKLDIYLPDAGEGPYPVIIDIFGGGWYFGEKSSYKLDMALNFLDRGYAVVSIGYTLSREARFPTQIYEIKAAVRYVRNHSAEYGLNPDNVFIMGESAGAHGGSVAAYSEACGMMTDIPFGESGSARVNALALLYCPTDVTLTKYQFGILGLDTWVPESGEACSPEGILYGGRISDLEDEIKKTSVFNMLCPQAPPAIFFHGSDDRVVPILQSMNFAVELLKVLGPEHVSYNIVPGVGHVQQHFMNEENYDKIDSFFRSHMT